MNIRERITRLIRPLRVRVVQFLIGALIASVLTTWWLTNVGPSISYRLAAEQTFELWLALLLILVVAKMPPRRNERRMEIPYYWFTFITGGFTAALLIFWGILIRPEADLSNIVKAHISLILVVGTVALIAQTIKRVEDGYHYQQMLERRAREPVDYTFLR